VDSLSIFSRINFLAFENKIRLCMRCKDFMEKFSLKNSLLLSLLLLSGLIAFPGCSQTTGTLGGAAAGTGVGAGLGYALGGKGGAIAGGVIGGLAGGAVGSHVASQSEPKNDYNPPPQPSSSARAYEAELERQRRDLERQRLEVERERLELEKQRQRNN
jgi:hypothetical protein